ncbi:MAG: hypothetical protein AB7T15_03110 [Desulfuromonas sp.]
MTHEPDSMDFKPDYGLRLLCDGVSPETDHFFYSFPLFSVTVLGRGQYSTMVEDYIGSELHALSLDFNQEQLEQILAKGESNMVQWLRDDLDADPTSQRTIELAGVITFGVRARLGTLQKGAYESFVPLVVQEIL